jgi:hypothetical protein
MSRPVLAAVLAVGCALTACSSPDDEENCAAVIGYGEPVFTIDSARALDGRPVGPVVVLSGLRLDGQPVAGDWRHTESFGLEDSRGAGITCRVPCGFGHTDGILEFTASTPDGLHVSQRAYLTYRTSDGCGPTLHDGTHLDIVLAPGRDQ